MPHLNQSLAAIPYSVFEEINRCLARLPRATVAPLHQGRTWFAPPDPAAGEATALDFAAHQHAPPSGIPLLRERIARHLADRSGLALNPDHIVITAGATHAISIALQAILDPGDEVLVASPQWLFAVGLIAAARGKAVEVPVFSDLVRQPDYDFVRALDRAVTARTRALYFNTPNNPTGFSLRPEQLSALASWARRRDLWLIADNAYENFDYTQSGVSELARTAAERVFTVYTFSKTYAMPGWRSGFIVCPPDTAERLRKWELYSVYSISTASQRMAFAALDWPLEELEARRAMAREARDLALRQLAIPHTPVDGGLYAWLDLSGWKNGSEAFVARCAEKGVGLAPGRVFGASGAGNARMCFTAVPPDRLARAIDIMNTLYSAGPER